MKSFIHAFAIKGIWLWYDMALLISLCVLVGTFTSKNVLRGKNRSLFSALCWDFNGDKMALEYGPIYPFNKSY